MCPALGNVKKAISELTLFLGKAHVENALMKIALCYLVAWGLN